MNRLEQFSVCCLLAGLLLSIGGCGTSAPKSTSETTLSPPSAGYSLAELAAQNLAPLEIVSFTRSSGVGDVVMGMALQAAEESEDTEATEAESDVVVQRHVLKVANVSNRMIQAFRGALTYEDENGQLVATEEATPDVRYAADPGSGIAPGATEELDVQLLVPNGAKAKFQFAEILYQEGNLGGIWTPAETEKIE